jgi:predicted nuclease with TOPRIM domain
MQSELQTALEEKEALLEENQLLRQTIVDLKDKHEAFKKETNRETTELLKKYSTTVVSLHQRLRKLTDKFEETEKLKKGQFRKFRKAME